MGDTPPPRPGQGAEKRGAGDGYTTRQGGAPGREGGRPAGRAAGSRGPPPAPGEGSLASGPAPELAGPAPAPHRAIGPRPLARLPAAHRPSSAPPLPACRGGPLTRRTLGLVVQAAYHLPAANGRKTTTPRGARGRARPPGHPTPSPSFAKPPSLFLSPLPPISHGAQSWPIPTYTRSTKLAPGSGESAPSTQQQT